MTASALHPTRSPWRLFWTVIAGAIALWLVVALVVAPWVSRAAPDSLAASLLGAWRASTRDGVLILLAFGAVVRGIAALRRPAGCAWIPLATAEGLGATRLWIATILLASVLWEDLASSAYLPRAMLNLDAHWLVGALHGLPIGFDRMLASATALHVFESVTALLLFMAAAGALTRWTVPAGALAYLVFAAILRSYAWSYHTGLIPLYALFLLSFTPCGDGLSVDRWLRRRRGAPVAPAREPSLAYGLGRYLVWMGIAIPYTMAGLSKLRNTGLDWWRGEHLKQMVLATVVEPMHFDFELAFLMLRGPDWIFDLLGASALLTEVTFVLVLVSALARVVLPAVMACTHVGILLMQNILFPDLIAIQAVFYDWTPLRRRLTAWAARVLGPARPPTAPRQVGGEVRLAHASPGEAVVRREAAVASGFLALVFIVWATRTERFPLSAMQMFSRPVTIGPVEYVRPIVEYDDGTRERGRFERWIGAMADTRYRRVLRGWDSDPAKRARLEEFLDAAADRAAAAGATARRIRRFELELRRWDFRRNPDDPQRGALVQVLRHDVRAPTAGLER